MAQIKTSNFFFYCLPECRAFDSRLRDLFFVLFEHPFFLFCFLLSGWRHWLFEARIDERDCLYQVVKQPICICSTLLFASAFLSLFLRQWVKGRISSGMAFRKLFRRNFRLGAQIICDNQQVDSLKYSSNHLLPEHLQNSRASRPKVYRLVYFQKQKYLNRSSSKRNSQW